MLQTYLSQCELFTPTKEGLCILQQRLNLLGNDVHEVLAQLLLFLVRLLEQNLEPEAARLRKPRVNEESNAGASQCSGSRARGREKVRGVCVRKELRNDARLSDDFAVEVNRGDEPALEAISNDLTKKLYA